MENKQKTYQMGWNVTRFNLRKANDKTMTLKTCNLKHIMFQQIILHIDAPPLSSHKNWGFVSRHKLETCAENQKNLWFSKGRKKKDIEDLILRLSLRNSIKKMKFVLRSRRSAAEKHFVRVFDCARSNWMSKVNRMEWAPSSLRESTDARLQTDFELMDLHETCLLVHLSVNKF